MKTRPPHPRYFLWSILGFALAFTSLSLSRPFPPARGNHAAPTALATTSAKLIKESADAGSTDGIVLMAVIIVLIVLLPILFRHRDWENRRPHQ